MGAAERLGIMSKKAQEEHDEICHLLVQRWPLPQPLPPAEEVMARAMKDSSVESHLKAWTKFQMYCYGKWAMFSHRKRICSINSQTNYFWSGSNLWAFPKRRFRVCMNSMSSSCPA